jgi:hypothetical protein
LIGNGLEEAAVGILRKLLGRGREPSLIEVLDAPLGGTARRRKAELIMEMQRRFLSSEGVQYLTDLLALPDDVFEQGYAYWLERKPRLDAFDARLAQDPEFARKMREIQCYERQVYPGMGAEADIDFERKTHEDLDRQLETLKRAYDRLPPSVWLSRCP